MTRKQERKKAKEVLKELNELKKLYEKEKEQKDVLVNLKTLILDGSDDKLGAELAKLDGEVLADLIGEIARTKKVWVANWFNKGHVEDLTGETLTDEQMADFVNYAEDDTGEMDDISEHVSEIFQNAVDDGSITGKK